MILGGLDETGRRHYSPCASHFVGYEGDDEWVPSGTLMIFTSYDTQLPIADELRTKSVPILLVSPKSC